MKIDFYNLIKQDKKKIPNILKDIKKIIYRGDFILGKEVLSFEKKFSNYVGSRYAISCANGTDALTIALKSLDLPKNAEVIIPAMTYCSTAFSVINAGYKPVLVDIDDNKPTTSFERIFKKINFKTKVIMPVHLYGSVVDLEKNKIELKKIKKKIYLIDDCAQAHGAIAYKKKKTKLVGATADISCFSFYPGKNLGAYGDAGIITTNNNKFHFNIKKIRNLGALVKSDHELIGLNSRMDTIQAAILKNKISLLNKNNYRRRKIANYYEKYIKNSKITKLSYSKYAVYHQYVVIVKNRNSFTNYLKSNFVGFSFHYSKAIHQHRSLKKYFKNQSFKNAEMIARYGVSIPIDPSLNVNQVKYIVKILNNF